MKQQKSTKGLENRKAQRERERERERENLVRNTTKTSAGANPIMDGDKRFVELGFYLETRFCFDCTTQVGNPQLILPAITSLLGLSLCVDEDVLVVDEVVVPDDEVLIGDAAALAPGDAVAVGV